jgi:hypothetical protein
MGGNAHDKGLVILFTSPKSTTSLVPVTFPLESYLLTNNTGIAYEESDLRMILCLEVL